MDNNKKGTGRNRRKRITQRKRRPKIWRIIIFIIIIILIVFVMFRGYRFASSNSTMLFTELNTIYDSCKEKLSFKNDTKDVKDAKTDIQPKFSKMNNILFIGVDKYNAAGNNASADTLFVFNINNNDGTVSILSIPRNTAVPSGNAAVPIGSLQQYGTGKTLEAVSGVLNMNIDQYVIMDEDALMAFINAFNGVDIYVGADMDYYDAQSNTAIHLKKGYQHLDGKMALEYLQYRSDDLGDIGRVERQNRFLKSFYAEALDLGTITKMPAVIKAADSSIYTNTNLYSLASLKNYILAVNKNSIIVKLLPGKFSPDGRLWQPNTELINSTVQEMLAN